MYDLQMIKAREAAHEAGMADAGAGDYFGNDWGSAGPMRQAYDQGHRYARRREPFVEPWNSTGLSILDLVDAAAADPQGAKEFATYTVAKAQLADREVPDRPDVIANVIEALQELLLWCAANAQQPDQENEGRPVRRVA